MKIFFSFCGLIVLISIISAVSVGDWLAAVFLLGLLFMLPMLYHISTDKRL